MRSPKIFAVVGTLLLGGCATSTITTGVQTIESEIQSATASLCGFVPTLETIDGVAAAVAGVIPGIGTSISVVLGLGATGLAAVEQDICSTVPPPASASFRKLARIGSPHASKTGVLHYTTMSVPVTGWAVR